MELDYNNFIAPTLAAVFKRLLISCYFYLGSDPITGEEEITGLSVVATCQVRLIDGVFFNFFFTKDNATNEFALDT